MENMYASVELLLEWGCASSPCNENNETPLHLAAKNDLTEIANILSLCDSNVNMKTNITGDTALHFAARINSLNMCKILLSNCCQHTIQNNVGNTPAHDAASLGYSEIFRLLIDYDADMNIKNFDGMTPLGLARLNCHKKLLFQLLMKCTLK